MEMIKQWPSEGWRDAFRLAATPETMQAAVRRATIELARLERIGITVPWCDEDLAQQVLAATCAGTLTWDPDAFTLRAHLCDKIRQVGRRLRGRLRFEHEVGEVSLDHLSDEDPLWNDAALSATEAASALVACDLARRVEAELWRLAAGDQVALRVLAAMTEGAVGETDIAEVSGLPVTSVKNARKRIRRLARCMPADLLSDIRAELNLEASSDGGA